ncbi:hypothetical protein C1645_737392 [Glomus cerebriforme]|uniref:Uncharacterized protein n=1 Tax=Glomus cerebriforme TaxID=658196 RepID=A0A397T7I8_9GLOM|nr:hypothetical protein C1645_737392 [Glomus cerebriforme]
MTFVGIYVFRNLVIGQEHSGENLKRSIGFILRYHNETDKNEPCEIELQHSGEKIEILFVMKTFIMYYFSGTLGENPEGMSYAPLLISLELIKATFFWLKPKIFIVINIFSFFIKAKTADENHKSTNSDGMGEDDDGSEYDPNKNYDELAWNVFREEHKGDEIIKEVEDLIEMFNK